jgi:hypothetical protein
LYASLLKKILLFTLLITSPLVLQRDVITAHADGAFTAMTVAAFSVFAGVWYWMKDTDKADKAGMKLP